MLAAPEGEREESTHHASQRSDPEREVLALLRRPAREALTLSDIHDQLLTRLTELEIQSALIALIEKGLVAQTHNFHFIAASAGNPKSAHQQVDARRTQ